MTERYLFSGDSITDGGRLWLPEYKGLGNGYVRQISLAFEKQGMTCEFLNRGHDGFTIQRILKNLDRDCLSLNPDYVTLLAGINNISAFFHTGETPEKQGFYEDYERILQVITENTNAQILCMGPFVFPKPAEYLKWIAPVLEMEARIRELTEKFSDISFLALHGPLNEAGNTYGFDAVTTDGIHLTEFGHALLCRLWIAWHT